MYDSNESHHQALGKIFRIAIFSFAGISGVALWTLVGQPLHINWTPKLSMSLAPTEHFLASVGDSLTGIKKKLTPVDTSAFTIALKTSSDDLARMRKVFENASWSDRPREMVFYKDEHIALGGELLAHMAGIDETADLAYGFSNVKCFYSHMDNETVGSMKVAVIDRERAYASMLKNENRILSGMLSLLHPDMSPSEVKTYVERGSSVVFHDDGTQERVLTSAAGEKLLSWKLTENELTISAN